MPGLGLADPEPLELGRGVPALAPLTPLDREVGAAMKIKGESEG